MRDANDDLISAHTTMLYRYLNILKTIEKEDEEYPRLINMCEAAIKEIRNSDKMSRWVGFIQGVLHSKGVISLDQERDFSRSIYVRVYKNHGFQVKTIDVKS